MSRFFRRVIVNYFGSFKNFIIWIVAVITTIYFIDNYVLTKDRIESIVIGPKNDLISRKIQNQARNAIPAQSAGDKKGEGTPAKSENSKDPANKPPDVKAPPDLEKGDKNCSLKEKCPAGKFPYYIQSGVGIEAQPTICFNGVYGFSPSKKNGHRGINLMVIDDKTYKVVETRVFDTYVEDKSLHRFLKMGIADNHILIATTSDEASANLKEDSKFYMRQFGSSAFDKIGFRDSVAFIGQKGLTHGSAIEKMVFSNKNNFPAPAELGGCLSIPMGILNEFKIQESQEPDVSGGVVPYKTQLGPGEEKDNCGVPDPCGDNAFPVHLFTGQGHGEGPKICVNGKYVLADGLNDGGRGINIAVVEPKTKKVIKVGHFDTYGQDPSSLEIFLEMMNPNEILMAVTHDDASRNLNLHVKMLLESFGATKINSLEFRDNFAFIGKKDMNGPAPYQEFHGKKEAKFAEPIDLRACVDSVLSGSQVKPDPLANVNQLRRDFCKKYDGYGDFCESAHIDEPLTPAALADKSLEKHAIFDVPIIVIPGLNHNAVRMQLETILMQPGIRPEMVTVLYDKKFDEPQAMANVFGFKSVGLSSSTKYVQQVKKALEEVWNAYSEASHVIVLEEEVILGPDFLNFMAQCLDVVVKDDTLIGVSAFNENGYEGVSSMPELVYRGKVFPGLGFLLKKSYYNSHMKDNFEQCCMQRSWDGWANKDGKEMLYPDTSRVYRRPYEGLSENANFLTELFNRPRITNLEVKPKLINNLNNLSKEAYEKELISLINAGSILSSAYAQDCLEGKGLGFYVPETSGKIYTIYYIQRNSEDFMLLTQLCKCFKLFHLEGYAPRMLHNGLLRFSYKGNQIFFIGSKTAYYKETSEVAKNVVQSSKPS